MYNIVRKKYGRLSQSQYGSLLRHRVFWVCIVSLPTYLLFGLNTLYTYQLPVAAATSGGAAFFTLLALAALFTCRTDSLPGHLFTLALAVQVFGEMAVNGGMQAGAASLSLLIVPLAFFTTGRNGAWAWMILSVPTLALLFYLDMQGLLPENLFSPKAQQVDLVLTFIIGMLVITLLIFIFDNQMNEVLAMLARDRADYKHAALHDELTGLPNRRFFYEKSHTLLQQSSGSLSAISLLFIDINLFKQINDDYGHMAGDAVLVEFATRLQKCADEASVVARLSGDEFAVIFENFSDSQWLYRQQEKIRRIVDAPILWNGLELKTGLSMGSAQYPSDGNDFDSLLSIADKRMYEDKTRQADQRPAACYPAA